MNAAQASLKDVNAIDLGALTLSGNLAITAGGAISGSGVLTVGGSSQFTALGQTITLASANDFVGSVLVSGAAVSLKDSNGLTAVLDTTGSTNLVAGGGVTLSGSVTHDLSVRSEAGVGQSAALDVGGTLTLHAAKAIDLGQANRFAGRVVAQAQDVSLQALSDLDLGAVTAVNGLSVVSTGGAIAVHTQPIAAARLILHAATGIAFERDMTLTAESVDLSAAQDLGSSATPLRLAANRIALSSAAGGVFIQLLVAGPVHAQVVADGAVSVMRTGSLDLASGSIFESKTDTISVIATEDLLVSGTTLLAKSALLKSGQSIKATAQENAAPVSITGELRLEAMSGIGGFGFERVLVHALSMDASVSAYNGQIGDVVIAGQNGLTISADGVRSDSDGWVGLLGGTGAINEHGQVVARSSNVVRMTGANWINRNNADANVLLSAALKSGALSVESSSPLERLNQRLAQSWSLITPPQSVDEALTSSAQLLSTNSRMTLGVLANGLAAAGTGSVMGRPQTTVKLLEMAMAITRQGNNPSMSDTENLGAWVNRPVSNSNPETGLTRPDVLPQPPSLAKPVLPNSVNGQSISPLPKDPEKSMESAPDAPDAPGEVPAAPVSDVRWLMLQDDLQKWASAVIPVSTQSNLLSSLSPGWVGELAKFGQLMESEIASDVPEPHP